MVYFKSFPKRLLTYMCQHGQTLIPPTYEFFTCKDVFGHLSFLGECMHECGDTAEWKFFAYIIALRLFLMPQNSISVYPDGADSGDKRLPVISKTPPSTHSHRGTVSWRKQTNRARRTDGRTVVCTVGNLNIVATHNVITCLSFIDSTALEMREDWESWDFGFVDSWHS
jgi:hypothetical protein